MTHGPTGIAAFTAVLFAVATAHAQDSSVTDRETDARDGISVPSTARSVRVLREGEVVHVSPDGASARRGALARDAYVPALEATAGSGCQSAWVRIDRAAWVCMDEARYAIEEPGSTAASVDEVTYQYAFATFAGVRTYRRLNDVANEAWAEELERGMGVAVDHTERFDGQMFAHTASARWIAATDLRWATPSPRQGVVYGNDEAVSHVAFTSRRVYRWSDALSAALERGSRPLGFLVARVAVHITEEQTIRGHRVVETDQGWLAASALRFAEVGVFPDGLSTNERWVDVDLRHQILVAMEGTRPIYAALISSGSNGHATTRGSYRVWAKLRTGDMSNADDDTVDTATRVYSVERVPWVMYFNHDQALHGVYWHDQFGTVHSHGCVNLPPRDARWLFDWAPPRIPSGWTAVIPTSNEQGLLVRVH